MENIDITSLINAVNSLKEVVVLYKQNYSDAIIRDSLIQRFEYTYSLSLKMIKRFFKVSAFVLEDIESMTFNATIRQANKMKLLKSDLEKWDVFRQKRNMTAHTYDETVAKDVANIACEFLEEAEYLVKSLKEKIQ